MQADASSVSVLLLFLNRVFLELDQYIGSTHNQGQLWVNRNHQNNRQSMTSGDQSMPMFQDEDTHRIHQEMSSIGHPCSTIQGSTRYLSLMRPAVVLLPR